MAHVSDLKVPTRNDASPHFGDAPADAADMLDDIEHDDADIDEALDELADHDHAAPTALAKKTRLDAIEADLSAPPRATIRDIGWPAFEADVAALLDVERTDEFLSHILGSLSRAARRWQQARTRSRAAIDRADMREIALSDADGTDIADHAGDDAFADDGSDFSETNDGLRGRTAAPYAILAPLANLIATGASDADAFASLAGVYADDGIDAALPALVALAAWRSADTLGRRDIAQQTPSVRRQYVRGIGAPAQALVASGTPAAVRTLSAVAETTIALARRAGAPERQLALRVARQLPRTAARAAANPELQRRLTRTPPATPGHATSIDRGLPAADDSGMRR